MSIKADHLHDSPPDVPVIAILPGAEVHAKVVALTSKLFDSSVMIEKESDHELPEEYFVVSAIGKGEVASLVRKHHQWHVEMYRLIGDLSSHYRLDLDVQ